jgi:hypothetical protein
MPNKDEMPDMADMAPPDPEWHLMYAKRMQQISKILDSFYDQAGLQIHPGAEDLGDWVETLSSLMSFRPHTDKYFEDAARENPLPT